MSCPAQIPELGYIGRKEAVEGYRRTGRALALGKRARSFHADLRHAPSRYEITNSQMLRHRIPIALPPGGLPATVATFVFEVSQDRHVAQRGFEQTG